MRNPKQQETEKWTFSRTLPSRLDLNSADLVEQGVKLQGTKGTDCAAEFLKTNGIGVDVAIRVLARPSARRKNRVGSGKPLAPSPSLPRILRKPHMKGFTPF